jgi:hypothetical protein
VILKVFYYRAIVVWRCGPLENKFNNVNSPRNQCQRGSWETTGEEEREKDEKARGVELVVESQQRQWPSQAEINSSDGSEHDERGSVDKH